MSFAARCVTISKASRLLGKAPATLKKLLASGAIRYIETKGPNGRKLIHLGEIDRYQRFGAYSPSTIEEQTNAQSNYVDRESKKTAQITQSEIFGSDNQGATLPQEHEREAKKGESFGQSDTHTQTPQSGSYGRTHGADRVPMDEVEKADPSNLPKVGDKS